MFMVHLVTQSGLQAWNVHARAKIHSLVLLGALRSTDIGDLPRWSWVHPGFNEFHARRSSLDCLEGESWTDQRAASLPGQPELEPPKSTSECSHQG